MEDADSGYIVGGHHGRGPIGVSQDLAHRGNSTLERVVALAQLFWIGSEADLVHRSQKSLFAGARRMQVQAAADETNAAVTEDREVLHAFADAVIVVDFDGAEERPGG